MKKALTLLAIVSLMLVVGVFVCIVLSQTFLRGCLWWECAPERSFHVRDWELPASLFPQGALIEHISASSEGLGEKERGSQSILWPYGGAGYSIKRFASNRQAISNYEFQINQMADYDTGMPWAEPAQISFHSITADDVHIACGNGLQGTECGFTGRYQEYVIYYSSSIDDRMAYKDFEKVLMYIDEQISLRLYP